VSTQLLLAYFMMPHISGLLFILSIYNINIRDMECVDFETVASIKDPLVAKVITYWYNCVCLVPAILSSFIGPNFSPKFVLGL
jgi:hypothetical protein